MLTTEMPVRVTVGPDPFEIRVVPAAAGFRICAEALRPSRFAHRVFVLGPEYRSAEEARHAAANGFDCDTTGIVLRDIAKQLLSDGSAVPVADYFSCCSSKRRDVRPAAAFDGRQMNRRKRRT